MFGGILLKEIKGHNFSREELEKLEYYDFMSFLGVPYFHIGGLTSSEKLAELCQVERGSRVLMAGCGTGFSAVYLAKTLGCFVVGVDLAELSIRKARERAKKAGLEGQVDFLQGDAYFLPFGPGTFDVVITEFVSQFLNLEAAFREFVRVLNPGGRVGINEMYKERHLPQKARAEILEAERIFSGLTGLPFTLLSPEEWEMELEKAGLEKVRIDRHRPVATLGEIKKLASAMGGFQKLAAYFTGLMVKMARYSLASKKIRNRFRQLSKGKRVLLRKGETSRYVGYVLGVGKKA